MFLQSIASAVPPRAFSQEECWEIFVNSPTPARLKDRSVGIVQKILLGDNGIDSRHFALTDLEKLFENDAETLNREFEIAAPAVAGAALKKALDRAGLRADELDALVICTCTGYLCPGISSHVAEDLGMRPDVYLQDLVGLGCGAAIPTLRNAAGLVAAHPEARVATIAVEICSAAFYIDDDPGVLISACLFGDGAAAAIWSGTPGANGYGPLRCGGFRTLHQPENRETLRFENREGKLRNKLHRSVPEIAGNAVMHLLNQEEPDAVSYLLSHTGGRDVLLAIEAKLPDCFSLPEAKSVLKRYGNMSSPCVLFALEDYLESGRPVEKSLWLTSFGAGFACHSCRVWED